MVKIQSEVTGDVYTPKLREQRLSGRKVIAVLEKACVELVHVGKGRHELLSGVRHRRLLERDGRLGEIEDCRPDIVHQCLRVLLDSPLNRNGHLLVYIRTARGIMIEVSPQCRPPATYLEFESMMATLLVQKVVKAKEANLALLRVVKNDLLSYLPVDTKRIGFEVTGELVNIDDFARKLTDDNQRARESKQARASRIAQSLGFKKVSPSSPTTFIPSRSSPYTQNTDTQNTHIKNNTARDETEAKGRKEEGGESFLNISGFALRKARQSIDDAETQPVCFFIGAVAKGSPASKEAAELIEQDVKISTYPLSAAVCCSKLCHAFEQLWCR